MSLSADGFKAGFADWSRRVALSCFRILFRIIIEAVRTKELYPAHEPFGEWRYWKDRLLKTALPPASILSGLLQGVFARMRLQHLRGYPIDQERRADPSIFLNG